MNKQIAVNSEKRTSFFRRSSLNAANLVSTLRASTGNSSASSSSKTQRHEVSFGLPEEDAVRSVAPGATATPIGQPTAMDGSSSPSASVPASELPVPQVPTICTSFSHGLSTINERRSMEDDSLQHQIEVLDGSRTSSSCSMPDYLCHKLHSVTVNVPTTHNDTEDQNGKHFRTALGPSVAPQETVQPSSSTSRFVKESCDSSTSTTTSESYQLSDLPPLPGNCKLATLNKPSSQALLASALRSRKARHSIDVRSLPSYLARKRQSTFGQFLSALSPTAPEESSSSDDPLFSEPVAPTLSLGERVAWVKSSGPEFGVVRWIGRMPQVTNDWTVGVEFDNPIGSGAGTVEGRRYFVAKENFAKFLPLSDLTKVDNYAGRPRSGTMLSRMSVQLKPGQLISIQRSPTTAPHCYLNAPHHVGHDVHSPNNRHCQCASCNHPCAHICKTRKPKGKRWTEDMAHMCHFSSKPHAHMCCGGEDLPSAAQPIMEAGVSWKHSEVIASLRTVPTEYHPRRKSVTIHARDTAADFKKSPRQDVLHSPSYIRDNCSSALLERTGSDLSISSLPSSSSVAEVYIGRSVLTDESDIDSETERSLESSSKASNKQGLRSLVACFLANSLRLKKSDKEKKETKPSRSNGGKRVKKSSRSEKDKFRSKQHRPLGLSSTDVSSYADIPSSAPNSQPLPSLSLDTSRHANEPINRPAVLFSSPRFASSNHVRNTKTSNRNSPYRKNDLSQAHNIDGHISEEVTNSSNSSAPRLASIDRADSRPSTNASTDNAASPRRRRHKGPAPKPPITAQCSSSPLSTTNNVSTSCPSSVPQSPTNSSVATSLSASSRNQGALTKSPAPLPPNLTRSLSEQKQLNMKNLINAMPSFRSEVNLQDMSKSDATQSLSEDLMHTRENEENILLVCEDGVSKLVQKEQTLVSTYLIDEMAKSNHVDDSIYQTPLPIKTLFNEIPPEIPAKTFDHIKIFGCNYNNETKMLEKRTVTDNVSSPNMPRSQSMPFSRYTCCQYHWKEYLNALSKTGQIIKYDHQQGTAKLAKHVAKLGHEPECDHKCLSFINHEESECDSEDDHECFMPSELMNALLSPQQSRRYKRSKDLSNKSNHESLDSTKANPSSVCNVFDRFEFIRALSDGSLTNTSTATVVEFINEDSSNGEGKPDLEDLSNSAKGNLNLLTEISPNDLLNNSNQKCLSDVFCQTNFEEPPERPSRQYKNHKCSCRCRHPKQRNHGQNRHFRHRQCAHHDCCSATQAMTCFGDIRTASRNAWLTSSTSDHSLSSLSSSTSTLSEASTVRTSSTLSNDMSNCKSQHQCTSSMSPFVESLSHFTSADINFYSTADTLAELISGRSPISTERLFKSAENNFQPLVDAESNNEFSAFNQVHPKSSTTAQLENFAFDKKSSDIFEDLTSDMFMNQSFSLPSKLSNDQSLSEESKNKCLMSELEVAIANGNHQRAAILAKELAIKRVNCSLSGKLSNGKDKSTLTSPIVAYLYIEDRNTHKGPIPFQVYPSMSVNMLSLKVEKEFNISSEMQKWVLGRNIVTNLSATLSTYGINNSGCPIFLYVLSSPHPSNSSRNSENINKPINDVTKTNGNLSDDDDVYESLRSPAMMPYVSYDAKMEQSLNSKSNTLPRKAVNSIDKESSTNFTPLNSASYSSNSIDMAIGQTFGSTGHSNLNANTVQHASNQSQSFVPSVSLANSVNLMKNYYYQEGEIPFANQLIFEGLSLVNELLPRVEEEDEDDLEDEEDEITAKNVNGITDAALNEANQIPLPTLSTYQKLVELEDVKCVLNVESFECPICFGRFKPGEGVVLRECLHTFCRDCLRGTIEYNEEVQVKCPFRDDFYSCDCTLQDREIKELASFETYERYLKKSISVAEKNVDKSFHCKSTDCPGQR